MTRALEGNPNIRELSDEEGRELFDRQARRYLNMSGEEFIRRWDAGEFDEGPENPAVVRLAMLLPFAR
jgi:hypothetical protein